MYTQYDIPNTKFNIEIDETNLNKYISLLENINDDGLPKLSLNQRSPKYLSDLFKYYLKLSSYNEKEVINEETINKIDEYLKECNVPEITKLYSLLFDEVPCFRSPTDPDEGFVGVYKRSNHRREEFYNIGMKASDIDGEQLQNLVNYYYQLQKENIPDTEIKVWGFICYLLYERIHPHHDGNGRIGRLLFIENTYNRVYLPLSEFIAKAKQQQHLLQNIYNKVNFKYIHYINDSSIKYPDTDKYYKLTIDDELLKGIFKCLCICKEYKLSYDRINESENNPKICEGDEVKSHSLFHLHENIQK